MVEIVVGRHISSRFSYDAVIAARVQTRADKECDVEHHPVRNQPAVVGPIVTLDLAHGKSGKPPSAALYQRQSQQLGGAAGTAAQRANIVTKAAGIAGRWVLLCAAGRRSGVGGKGGALG